MIRHLYGDAIEYIHNKEGITSEETTYSLYYSTSEDERNILKTVVIDEVVRYEMPINNEMLKILYKFVEVSYNRYGKGHKVMISEEEKRFIKQFEAYELAAGILSNLYSDDKFRRDEDEICSLARRIIVGFGNEITAESYQEAGSELLKQARSLAEETIGYMIREENINIRSHREEIIRYLINTWASILVADYLKDNTFDLKVIFKDDTGIKGQFSFSLAFRIYHHLKKTMNYSMSRKAIISLSIALHFIITAFRTELKKVNVVLTTEYYREENLALKQQLLSYDRYECINRIDICYLYFVAKKYADYDIAIFDFPSAYFKRFPIKSIYLNENDRNLADIYRTILNHALNFRRILVHEGFAGITYQQTSESYNVLIRRLLSETDSLDEEGTMDMIDVIRNSHMLIQNGILIVMNHAKERNSVDIYRVNTSVVKDSKTFVDTVCFVNYSFHDSLIYVKIVELMTYDIRKLMDYMNVNRTSHLDLNETIKYISRIYEV